MTNQLTFFQVTGTYYAVADPSISGVVNTPIIQPINALATFTPRLPEGEFLYVQDYLVTIAYNAEQTFNLLGEPTGGTYTLSFGGATTDPIAWDASASQIQTALRAISTIGANNCTVVAGIEPNSFDVEFTGALGLTEIPPMSGNADDLSNVEGQGFCEVTVTETALGSPQVVADTAIALPPLTARIWNGVLSTIDYADTPGFQLVSNSAALGLDGDLIYDVTFNSATYNGASQVLAPLAFAAPVDTTPICLTDPTLPLLDYKPPNTSSWTPTGSNVSMKLADVREIPRRTTWRQRAVAR